MGWAGWSESRGALSARGPESQAKKKNNLTYLQICGCGLYKNAFGGRAPPGPAGELYRSPRPPSRYKGKRREGMGRKGLEIGGGSGCRERT